MHAHHDILEALSIELLAAGWSQVEEIPVVVDLWARSPSGQRVIFEAKTLTPRSELTRVRGGIAQLLEYRFVYGKSTDRLCLVTNHPISDKRVRFLAFLGIAVVVLEKNGRLVPGSPNARSKLGQLFNVAARTVESSA